MKSISDNPWQKINEEVVYDNSWIQVTHSKVINPSGSDGIYGSVHFKNWAIGIIPLDMELNTWIVGQYRYPLNQYSWEIPEGGSPLGTSSEETAKRECLEETGCEVKKLTPIQGYFPAPGSSESFYYLFLGEIETFDGERIMGLKTENEDILVRSYKIEEVKNKMNKKEILNGLSLIALQWFFLNIYKD